MQSASHTPPCSFFSLPRELRDQIYIELRAPVCDFCSPACNWSQQYCDFCRNETGCYGYSTSLLLVNKQIHGETLEALYRNAPWPFEFGTLYREKNMELALKQGYQYLHTIELQFSMCETISDVTANSTLLGSDSQKHLASLEDKLARFSRTVADMPALRTVSLGWYESFSMRGCSFSRSSKECFLGCGIRNGLPKPVVTTEEAELWVGGEGSSIARPCVARRISLEDRIERYWQLVKIAEKVIGGILEPLLGLSSRCDLEKGPIFLHEQNRLVTDNNNALEIAFSNAIDSLIATRRRLLKSLNEGHCVAYLEKQTLGCLASTGF